MHKSGMLIKKLHDSKGLRVYHFRPFSIRLVYPPTLQMPVPRIPAAPPRYLPLAMQLRRPTGRALRCSWAFCLFMAPLAGANEAATACPNQPSARTPAQVSASAPSSDGAMSMSADEASYDPAGQLFLRGEVTLDYGPYRATSEQAVLDQTTQQVRLDGEIRIDSHDLAVRGRDAILNLENGAAEVSNASFQHKSSGLRGQAESVFRQSATDLSVREGFFTSCAPEDKSWSFAVEEVEMDQVSGFGTARHARFQIQEVPVFYAPWFRFPIDDRRHSGFLYPSLGSSNTGSGAYLTTPYYFNIAPHMDATLTPSYIHQRGWHNALEFRHLGSYTYSTLAVSGIEPDEFYATEQRNLGNLHASQRWGLSFDQAQNLASVLEGWSGNLHYEAVSDNDYLEDLSLGLHTGSTTSLRREFQSSIVRDNWLWTLQIQSPKALDETLLPADQPYQTLPELAFNYGDLSGPLSLDMGGRYSYFYRQQSEQLLQDKVIGSRAIHTLRLSVPLRQQWGYLEPAVGLHQSDYFLQDYRGPGHVSRSISISELDGGLYFDRNVRIADAPYRLSLEPRLYYVYVPFREQSLLPEFDSSLLGFQYERLFSARRFSGEDRIADQSRLTLGLTHRWYRPDLGRELGRVSIAQLNWLQQTKTQVAGRTLAPDDQQYAASAQFEPTTRLRVFGDYLWSDTFAITEESHLGFGMHSKDYRNLVNFGLRYVSNRNTTEDAIEQSDSSAIIAMTESLSVLGRWRYDLKNNRTTGTLAGLEYRSCCWRAQLLGQSYLDDKSEISHAILLRFQLTGIGGFGADKEALEQIIPGYALREERAF